MLLAMDGMEDQNGKGGREILGEGGENPAHCLNLFQNPAEVGSWAVGKVRSLSGLILMAPL